MPDPDEGSTLSDLDALAGTLATTDRLYAVRSSDGYRATISQIRILAAQIGNSTAVGQAAMTAADAAALRTAAGLAALAVLSTVGSSQIDAAAVTLAKLADLATNNLIIGDGSNRPSALEISATILALLNATDVADSRTALELDPEAAISDNSDAESGAYPGIDNAQVGSVYATVADVNALRVSYEVTRLAVNTLLAELRTLALIDP